MSYDDYGKLQWRVETPDGGYIDLLADRFEVTPIGALVFTGVVSEQPIPTFALAPGQWSTVYLLPGQGVIMFWGVIDKNGKPVVKFEEER